MAGNIVTADELQAMYSNAGANFSNAAPAGNGGGGAGAGGTSFAGLPAMLRIGSRMGLSRAGGAALELGGAEVERKTSPPGDAAVEEACGADDKRQRCRGAPPRDLGTKASVRLVAHSKLEWLRAALHDDRAASHALTAASWIDHRPSDPAAAVQASLLTWVHPHPSDDQAAIADAKNRWRAAFLSLYSSLRHNGPSVCPMFYYCEPDLEVVFTSAQGACGRAKASATISRTNKALRQQLKKEGVKTVSPMAPPEAKRRKTEPLAVACEDEDGENAEPHADEEQEVLDWNTASAAFASGARRCHALFNFLLERGTAKASAGVPPVLLSPSLFAGASLYSMPARLSKALSGAEYIYTAEVGSAGVPTPAWVWTRFAEALRPLQEMPDFELLLKSRLGGGTCNGPLHAAAKAAGDCAELAEGRGGEPWSGAPSMGAQVITSCKVTDDRNGWRFVLEAAK